MIPRDRGRSPPCGGRSRPHGWVQLRSKIRRTAKQWLGEKPRHCATNLASARLWEGNRRSRVPFRQRSASPTGSAVAAGSVRADRISPCRLLIEAPDRMQRLHTQSAAPSVALHAEGTAQALLRCRGRGHRPVGDSAVLGDVAPLHREGRLFAQAPAKSTPRVVRRCALSRQGEP